MADTKISALTALTGDLVADVDELVIVDKSDATMAASGTTKRIVFSELGRAHAKRDIAVDQWTSIGGLFL